MCAAAAAAAATSVEQTSHSLKTIFVCFILIFVRLRARERARNRNDSIYCTWVGLCILCIVIARARSFDRVMRKWMCVSAFTTSWTVYGHTKRTHQLDRECVRARVNASERIKTLVYWWPPLRSKTLASIWSILFFLNLKILSAILLFNCYFVFSAFLGLAAIWYRWMKIRWMVERLRCN